MNLLAVAGVDKRRGGAAVLRGLDLSVPLRAIVALLGPSGCGKTTLLRLIAGFETADAGRIALDGRVLQGPGAFVAAERRQIGYVPQEGTLFPHLTVEGNVGFGLSRAERRTGRVGEALRLTGLAGLEARYPHELSGGQQQRTALARALAPRPALVLLDEPFSGLDLGLRRGVCADVVGLLRQSGATAILVTHDPQEAFASADLVGVMQGGAIAQFASPAEVYRRPVSVAVARLTGAAILLDGQVERGQAGRGWARTALGPVELAPGSPDGGAVRVLLRPEQVVVSAAAAAAAVPVRLLGASFRGDHSLATVQAGDERLDLPLVLPDAPAEVFGLQLRGPCMAYGVEGGGRAKAGCDGASGSEGSHP